MRKLHRPDEPPPLRKARARRLAAWGLLGGQDHAAVRRALEQMQRGCCAYCEVRLGAGGGHVDHFRKQADHPELRFDWENLCLSCDADQHCARHKDALQGCERPDYARLLDPCRDDPEAFLVFLSDGRLVPGEGLTAKQRGRAEETLRVFKLNAPALVSRRRTMARMFLDTLQGMQPCRWEDAIEAFATESGYWSLFRCLTGS